MARGWPDHSLAVFFSVGAKLAARRKRRRPASRVSAEAVCKGRMRARIGPAETPGNGFRYERSRRFSRRSAALRHRGRVQLGLLVAVRARPTPRPARWPPRVRASCRGPGGRSAREGRARGWPDHSLPPGVSSGFAWWRKIYLEGQPFDEVGAGAVPALLGLSPQGRLVRAWGEFTWRARRSLRSGGCCHARFGQNRRTKRSSPKMRS